METKPASQLSHVPVKSSAIESVGYDPETKTMEVRMKGSNKTYSYPGVPADEHANFMKSDSMGKHLAAHIRPKYSIAKQAA